MVQSNQRKLILAMDCADGAQFKKENEEFVCLFLSRNYDHFLKLKANLPQGFHFIETGELLNETAHNSRRAYIDFIGSLNSRFASLEWFITRISEKNVMCSPAFLYTCYLIIVQKLLNNEMKDKNICIFAENKAVLETIARLNVFSLHKKQKMYSFNYLHEKIDNCVLILRFLIVGLKRSFWAGQTRKDSEKLSDDEKSKEFTIIRTWLGEKSFGSNGVFNDPYFMNLSDYLKKEGESVIVLPILYSLKRSYKEALLWLRQSNTQFIIPEDHYHFSDYLAALLTAFRANSFARESFSFAALDLSLLFRDELIRSQFELGLLQITMHFSLMKRLKEKGIKIKKVIFTFENMVHEKPLLLGAAKYYPQASTIGFQHSVLYPLLLSFFVSSKEINSLPIPKKIVCSGKFFKEKLQEEGYPASRLFEGPALRFQYLLKEQAWRNKNSDGALITLPLIKTSSLELLIKSWQALKDFPQIKVLIKAHPMMPKQEIDEIISAAGIKKENLALIDCSMQEALAQAGFVIAMASGTIFDALAFGLPVIRVRQDMDLNLDPLDWFASDQFQFVGRTADEIKENINKIVALSDSQRSAIKQKGQELIERCFSPINDQTLTSLLN